jgi:putative radical SAM enzyme (TIGR03279 family)
VSLARVVSVAPESPARAAGLAAGDEILAVNGSDVHDVIEYRVQTDDALVELEVRRGGLDRLVTIEKAAGVPLGLELSSAVFDRVRTCDNHCPFCFIYQLPKGMRRSLYLKDDDYRLSFLYGNFTTLTRFTEADLERVIDERLSPIYVSIHATDPEVRTRLLRNRRGATSLRWLDLLLRAGIEVHGQVVVCPGINDGAVLDDTLRGVLDRFPRLATVGVVPLGVSAHTTEPDMRPHTTAEAVAVLDAVDVWQARYLDVLGRRLVFASDEYYLLAGRPFPGAEQYDDFAQHENGIGMAASFAAEVDVALAGSGPAGPVAPREHASGGFFAWVDGAPAEGYRAPRRRRASRSHGAAGTPVTILTGTLGAPVLEPLAARLGQRAGVAVTVRAVENRFFGGNIGVTGLLTSVDVRDALSSVPSEHRVLLPDVVLSRDRFLDGGTLADLPRSVEVVETDGASLVAAVTG